LLALQITAPEAMRQQFFAGRLGKNVVSRRRRAD
jgi:hypothetical protein